MHCNLRSTEPRQSISAWINTHAKFEVAEPIHLRIIGFLLLTHYFTLWPWPLTFDLKHLQYIACDVMKLSTKYECNRAISIRGAELCDLNIWPNDLEHCVTCYARLCDNFHRVWPSTTYPCLNYSVLMLICYVTLWPWPLTLIFKAVNGQKVRHLASFST